MKRTMLSVPFVTTTAIAIYLLATWWRIAQSETLLFPFHNLLLNWQGFAPVAAIGIIVISALIYHQLFTRTTAKP